MAARKTMAEVQSENNKLTCYRSLAHKLLRGAQRTTLKSGDTYIEVIGLCDPDGGVVVTGGYSVSWASDWCHRALSTNDVYLRDLAIRIERVVKEAAKERLDAS